MHVRILGWHVYYQNKIGEMFIIEIVDTLLVDKQTDNNHWKLAHKCRVWSSNLDHDVRHSNFRFFLSIELGLVDKYCWYLIESFFPLNDVWLSFLV